MARSSIAQLGETLQRVVDGDVRSLGAILTVAHEQIREAAEALGTQLVVSRSAASSVLQGVLGKAFSPAEAQAWASFARRGYAVTAADGPVKPLDIEFEEPWEDEISAAVSRLDEIGDVVDGEITSDEALNLFQLLGKP